MKDHENKRWSSEKSLDKYKKGRHGEPKIQEVTNKGSAEGENLVYLLG